MKNVKTEVYFLDVNLSKQLCIDLQEIASGCESAVFIAKEAIETFLKENNLLYDSILIKRNNKEYSYATKVTFTPVFICPDAVDAITVQATNIKINTTIDIVDERGNTIVDTNFELRVPEKTTFETFVRMRNKHNEVAIGDNLHDTDIDEWFADIIRIPIKRT